MKLITRDTDYAVRSLIFIARSKGKIVSVSDVVIKLKMPRPFLRKILQLLNKKGVLKSYRGQGGGFILADLPNKIFLIDLIEIFQGRCRLNECMFKRKVCPNIKACRLRARINNINKYVVSQLGDITLESLMYNTRRS